MQDETEEICRFMQAVINADAATRTPEEQRAEMEKQHGQVWATEELQRDFEVLGFGAPFVVVRRRSDGIKGSLLFSHSPRFYFSFTPA